MEENIIKRNLWLDLFKIFLAWLVICIHFIGRKYEYYDIYRLAVPMFFMISGYFIYNRDNSIACKKAVTFIKRTAMYLLIGFVIYIVYDFVICLLDNKNLGSFFTSLFYKDFIFEFILKSRPITSGYHLWFLVAMIIVSIVHYFIVKFKKQNLYYFLIPIGIFASLFFSGYIQIIQNISISAHYTRNALFTGIPMFGIGYCLARVNFNRKNFYKYIYLILGIACFFLQILESKIVYMEYYISTTFSAAFLLMFFVCLKPIKSNWYYNNFGKAMPFYIYILHLAVGKLLERFIKFSDPTLKSFVILFACILIYEIVFLSIKLIKHITQKNKKEY